MSKRAFTLIELLVVIAIIAVLMGILMPALQKARKQARELICISNLKQYGISSTMYLNDYNLKFPNPQTWLHSDAAFLDYCAWHDASKKADGPFWYYMRAMDVHMCPTFASLAKSYGPSHMNHDATKNIPINPQYSYSMNVYCGGTALEREKAVSKSIDIKNPSKIILFTEENLWLIDKPVVLSTQCLNNNIFYTREGSNALDCLATYHKMQGNDVKSGIANIAFVDGSVGTGQAVDSYKLCLPKK
jgi:prepilin-type N-terminal cleavage/methylation domain-containing protein/prepilin-type processing-associated H-X9-DG protein